MNAILALLRVLPALTLAVWRRDDAALAAVHDRADTLARRPVFVPPLPHARPDDVFAVLANARTITTRAAR